MAGAIEARRLGETLEARPYFTDIPAEILGQPILFWREDIDALVAQAPAEAGTLVRVAEEITARFGRSASPVIEVKEDGGIPLLRLPSTMRDDECRRVAAELDRLGIAARYVRAALVDSIWDAEAGKRPSLDAITALMEGRKGGRPAKGPRRTDS